MAEELPGEVLREFRHYRGESRDAFAERTGWSEAILYYLETGRTRFTVRFLDELVAAGWFSVNDQWYLRFLQAVERYWRNTPARKA